MEMKGRMMVIGAMTLLTAGAQGAEGSPERSPLVGMWNHQDEAWEMEYKIEAVHEDGTLDAIACAKRKGGEIWLRRVKGNRTGSGKEESFEVDNIGAKQEGWMKGEKLHIVIKNPKNPWGTPLVVAAFDRTDKPLCSHRVRTPDADETNVEEMDATIEDGDSLVGEWWLRGKNNWFTELAVSKLDGRHAEGRMCTKKSSGDIFLFDFHKGGPTKARVDAKDGTLKITTLKALGGERIFEFWRSSNDRVLRTVTEEKRGKQRSKVRGMGRGRHPMACLWRTTERSHTVTGSWWGRARKGTKVSLYVKDDKGDANIKGVACTQLKDGTEQVTELTQGVKNGYTLRFTRENGAELSFTMNPRKPKVLEYEETENETGSVKARLKRTNRDTCAQRHAQAKKKAPSTQTNTWVRKNAKRVPMDNSGRQRKKASGGDINGTPSPFVGKTGHAMVMDRSSREMAIMGYRTSIPGSLRKK